MELAFPSATFDYKRVAKKGRASANMEYDGTSNVLPHWRFQPNPGKMGIPIGAATLCHRDTLVMQTPHGAVNNIGFTCHMCISLQQNLEITMGVSNQQKHGVTLNEAWGDDKRMTRFGFVSRCLTQAKCLVVCSIKDTVLPNDGASIPWEYPATRICFLPNQCLIFLENPWTATETSKCLVTY